MNKFEKRLGWMSSDLRKVVSVVNPMPRATLSGYIIVMGFLVLFLVGTILRFSENPLVAILILIVLLVVIALVTFIFVKLFRGLDQHRESTYPISGTTTTLS